MDDRTPYVLHSWVAVPNAKPAATRPATFDSQPLRLRMLRTQLKSKIHLACVTDANLDYEGSITIPEDLMREVDIWAGEKVLVVCRDTGARLETYAQPGPVGSAAFIINGAAARRIGAGDRITLMAFGQSETPLEAKRILCNEHNDIVKSERGIHKVTLPQQAISF